MEENDHTIESDEETSGVDAPSEDESGEQASGFDVGEQPSEATQWAQEAEQEGDESGLDPDEDLADLADDDSASSAEL